MAAPWLAPYAPDQHRPRASPRSRRRPRTGSAPTSSDATCSRACCTARACRSRSACCRRLVAGASGIAIGGVAGYAGGARRRRADARRPTRMLAVPRLPLLMIAAVVLQPSVPLLIVLIGLAGWMETARVVRAEFLTLRGARVRRRRAGGRRRPRARARRATCCRTPRRRSPCRSRWPSRAASCSNRRSASSASASGRRRRAGATCCIRRRRRSATEPWLALAPGLFILITTVSVNVAGDRLASAADVTRPEIADAGRAATADRSFDGYRDA